MAKKKTESKIKRYNPQEIEKKWQEKWKKEEFYKFKLDPNLPAGRQRKKYYNLVELPYPSGDLHLGHWFSFVTADTHARYKQMQGYNVFFPNGFDAFGLPAENAAIKRGLDPKEWTLSNIATMRKQFDTMGTMIDWSHEAITCLPEYYQWNQWIFLKMLERGLAYRGKALANWCPSCQTVLANENIESGKCWRCGTEVIQKEIEQWFLKITAYADRLLWPESKTKKSSEEDFDFDVELTGLLNARLDTKNNLSQNNQLVNKGVDSPGVEPGSSGVSSRASQPAEPTPQSSYNNKNNSVNSSTVDWPKSVREGQNKWIGKSRGINISYEVVGLDEKLICFTTTPVNFGATFLVIAPEHEFINKIINKEIKVPENIYKSIKEYVNKSQKNSQFERMSDISRDKTGVFTGFYVLNHVTNEEIPVWISDFVLASVGTGAVQGCPGHDMRDFDFAKKFGIPIKRVVTGPNGETGSIEKPEQVVEKGSKGVMINSDFLNGIDFAEAMQKTMDYFEEKGWGQRVTTYHIHDWSISRQRYWGTPIPVVHCPRDGIVGVPEDQLPVLLPEKVDFTPKGEPPLATAKEWLNTTCPKCGGSATREPETMDTFFDSSWYFYRYLDPHDTAEPFSKELAQVLMPVDIYYGGAEHTLGHTLYARFFTKFFKDLGLVEFDEFAHKRVQHGVILGSDGNRMSKSRGNVVNPDDLVLEFGSDTVRTYLCFMMPYEATAPWSSEGIWGCYRLLKRVWEMQNKFPISNFQFPISNEDLVHMHRAIKKVGEDIESMKLNTAVAAIMTWMNYLESKQNISRIEYVNLIRILAPFAPHMTEEIWQDLEGSAIDKGASLSSIHQEKWPKYDDKYLIEETVEIVVQINGKMRDSIRITNNELGMKENVEKLALDSGKVQAHIEGKQIKKVIYVPGKIINIVV